MWRPDKWNNPHDHELKDYQDCERIIVANPLHYEYEAGADAMLEALKALPISREINWEYMDSDTYRNIGLEILVQYQGSKVKGWLVFIPEEE